MNECSGMDECSFSWPKKTSCFCWKCLKATCRCSFTTALQDLMETIQISMYLFNQSQCSIQRSKSFSSTSKRIMDGSLADSEDQPITAHEFKGDKIISSNEREHLWICWSMPTVGMPEMCPLCGWGLSVQIFRCLGTPQHMTLLLLGSLGWNQMSRH